MPTAIWSRMIHFLLCYMKREGFLFNVKNFTTNEITVHYIEVKCKRK